MRANPYATSAGRAAPSAAAAAGKMFLQVALIALLLRSLAFQQFDIPSGSMKGTLLVGDHVLVSKYAYGYSRFSFPLDPPLFAGRVLAQQPQRGDVVVFRLPRDPSENFIKRVIGLPGDRIRMVGGVLHINGAAVSRRRVADFIDINPDGGRSQVVRWEETLPNGARYHTLDLIADGPGDTTPDYVVPLGHYFMMGDNRDNSTDSRSTWAVGFVPFDNIVGRAERVLFSIREGASALQFWRWPWSIRVERTAMRVR